MFNFSGNPITTFFGYGAKPEPIGEDDASKCQAPSEPTGENVASKYKALCAVSKTKTKTQAQIIIATSLLKGGHDVNAPIGEKNGITVNLLDYAIEQENDALIDFLVKEQNADLSLCNRESKENWRMKGLLKAEAYRNLCALATPDQNLGANDSTKDKIDVTKNLLGQGFKVNEPIHEEGDIKVNLLDLAIAQKDEAFIKFLIEKHGANPLFCSRESMGDNKLMPYAMSCFNEAAKSVPKPIDPASKANESLAETKEGIDDLPETGFDVNTVIREEIDLASKTYKSLCAETSQEKKEEIVKNLLAVLAHRFDVDTAIHEENGIKINLLDLAIAQKDDAFIRFLIQNCDANPLCCNANSKSNPRMKEFRDLWVTNLLGPSGIPSTSGKPTPAAEINANATQVSKCKLWERLYNIAKIPANRLTPIAGGLMYGLSMLGKLAINPAKALAFTVGGLMFGLTVLANLAIPRIIYLALSVPVLAAWTVGHFIYKCYGNEKLPVIQGVLEFSGTPAYALNSLMMLSRYALGLVSRVGAELMHLGYENEDFYTNRIDNISFSLSDLERNNTPVDWVYEKSWGDRGPSLGERIGRPDSISELCDLVRKFRVQSLNSGFGAGNIELHMPTMFGIRV